MSVAVEESKAPSVKGKHHLVPTAETSANDVDVEIEKNNGDSGAAHFEIDRSATTTAAGWSNAMCSTCTCVSALWCWSCYLANVMSRLGLNACAQPSPTCGGYLTCIVVVGLFMLLYVLSVVQVMLSTNTADYDHDDDIVTAETILIIPFSAIRAAIAIFLAVIVVLTRSHMRRRYNIRTISGDGCEDCMLACFCTSCVVAQMQDHVESVPTPPDVN